MKIISRLIGALVASTALVSGGFAQPISNPPGFQGKISQYVTGSEPWWPEEVKAPKGAPNVLIWMIDDVGFGQIGAFGGLIETPTLDSLAQSGLIYTNFHSTALCSPSRASLLTGRNPHNVGMGSHGASPAGFPGYFGQVPKSTASLAKILSDNGYTTYALGKWDQVQGEATSIAGPFDQWPSGQGFNHFYGFLAADTNNFLPDMWQDHSPIEPQEGRKDYHLSTDMADKAIEWITGQQSIAPEKPLMMYWATGAVHAPHHAPQEYVEKYRGRFDMGWDELRNLILKRQIERGIVPPSTYLPPRPPELPAWDSLGEPEKRMAARQMEAFAGQLDHADHEFGRIIEALRRTGELDNTIVVVTSDNGASAEGGPLGTYNEWRNLAGFPATEAQNERVYDEWGNASISNHYAAGWAMAGNTPFSWFKQSTHGGGIRSPMIFSYPAKVAEHGRVRDQFSHLNDITPTILDLIGVEAPQEVAGVRQKPMDGISLRYSFQHPDAPSQKKVQYFEMFGNRAIWADSWKAVALANRTPWDRQKTPEYRSVEWELYNVREDFNETKNLAGQNPQKLQEMLTLFDREARRYNVYPIGPDIRLRGKELMEARLASRKNRYVYYAPGAFRIPYLSSAPIYDHSFSLEAFVDVPSEGVEGVIMAQGGNAGGFSLYVKDGRPVFVHNRYGETIYTARSDIPLARGKQSIRVYYELAGRGGSAAVTMYIGNRQVGRSTFAVTQGAWSSATGDSFDIGQDRGSSPTKDYESPFPFFGKIDKVVIDILP